MRIIFHPFETLDSTNNHASQQAKSFDRDSLTVITANQQTSGRGRLERSWFSPAKENLYSTICFFMDSKRKDVGNIPQIMALAAAEELEKLDFSVKIKWPNDLLMGNQKLGGILTETQQIDPYLFVAVGIGLNINMSLENASLINRPITSLRIESGKYFEVADILYCLVENFAFKLNLFFTKGITPFLKSYQERLIHKLHTKMTFSSSQRLWEGRFMGINPDGTLILQTENGKNITFVDGEPLEPIHNPSE